MEIVLPDVDIWISAFSRQHPDPLVVHRLSRQVHARGVFLLGGVRQRVLGLTRDARQFARLETVLAAFPDLRSGYADQVEAARLLNRLRGTVALTADRALLWAAAQRIGAKIWSNDSHWRPFAAHGCPLAA